MINISVHWYNIGIHFHIPTTVLDKFRSKNRYLTCLSLLPPPLTSSSSPFLPCPSYPPLDSLPHPTLSSPPLSFHLPFFPLPLLLSLPLISFAFLLPLSSSLPPFPFPFPLSPSFFPSLPPSPSLPSLSSPPPSLSLPPPPSPPSFFPPSLSLPSLSPPPFPPSLPLPPTLPCLPSLQWSQPFEC